MTTTTQQNFIGEAKIYIAPYAGGPNREVGQVKDMKLAVTETTKEMANYQGGGGLAAQVSRISKVEATFDFLSISASNLALALRGSSSALTSAAVSSEAHTAYAGSLLPLLGIAPKSVTVTVAPALGWTTITAYTGGQIIHPPSGTHFYQCKTAGTAGVSEPTWKTDGTDTTDGTVTWTDMGTMVLAASEYTLESAGVFIPATATKITAAGTPVTVSYTKTAGQIIQAMVTASQEWRVIYSGTNFANADSPMVVDLFRCKFSPPKDISLIGEDFASLQITAQVLKDDTKTGAGISQFLTIGMVEA